MKFQPATPGLTRRATIALLASAAFTVGRSARAAVPGAFPKRQLTLVVPFSAGGPVDVLGRLLAQEYGTRSGLAAVVENRTGGAGNIGIEAVRQAPPDGSTLLLIPAGNLTINPTLMAAEITFDVARDFAPITTLASAPNVIVVSPKLGVTSMKQLIEKAKTQKLTYGSPGVGSQLHLTMEVIKGKTGIDILHVPYRGSPQALDDLLGDHIDMLATNLPSVLTAIRGALVVPVAMTNLQRSPLVPDVPTLAEAGIEGLDVTSWYGLLAPRAIPNDVRDALFDVTKEILKTPALQDALLAQGLSVMIEPPDDFAARIKRETAFWADVIKTRNITLQ